MSDLPRADRESLFAGRILSRGDSPASIANIANIVTVARILLAPIFTVYPQMGVEMILLAFIVVILGGMGSMGGSVVAAFVIGITQSLLTLWLNPQRVAIAIFGIMIVVLIVRPRGFFGREGVLE